MIQSKSDYIYYRKMDGTSSLGFKALIRGGQFRYKVLLRKAEYHTNVSGNSLHRLLAHYYKRRLSWFGQKLGYTIPINTCGHGLSLPHVGTIVINGKARIGNNCRIHVCVNIGASGGDKSAPVIGNGVYIAPGVKIYGDISIADGIAIGANAVVNKSFTQPNVTIAGLPAKVVGEGGAIAAGWNPS